MVCACGLDIAVASRSEDCERSFCEQLILAKELHSVNARSSKPWQEEPKECPHDEIRPWKPQFARRALKRSRAIGCNAHRLAEEAAFDAGQCKKCSEASMAVWEVPGTNRVE
jgi:hypothetical protein